MIIGLNPDNAANWIAGDRNTLDEIEREKDGIILPYWPREDAPPRITMGVFSYLPRAPVWIGVSNPNPCGFTLYKPTYAAVKATGIVEASSEETLGGIYGRVSKMISARHGTSHVLRIVAYLCGCMGICDSELLESILFVLAI